MCAQYGGLFFKKITQINADAEVREFSKRNRAQYQIQNIENGKEKQRYMMWACVCVCVFVRQHVEITERLTHFWPLLCALCTLTRTHIDRAQCKLQSKILLSEPPKLKPNNLLHILHIKLKYLLFSRVFIDFECKHV